MPSRIVRDGILTSERVNGLSWEEEVFYRRLMSVVDDYGRFDARPVVLRSSLYPLKLDQMREANIVRCLAAVEAAGLVRFYSVDGKRFLEIADFNQRIQSKPRWPDPPQDGSAPRVSTVVHRESRGSTAIDEDGVGVVNSSSSTKGFPSGIEEVMAAMRSAAECPPGVELELCAEKYLADRQCVGWRKKGAVITDWRVDARSYARYWARNHASNVVPGLAPSRRQNTRRRKADDLEVDRS